MLNDRATLDLSSPRRSADDRASSILVAIGALGDVSALMGSAVAPTSSGGLRGNGKHPARATRRGCSVLRGVVGLALIVAAAACSPSSRAIMVRSEADVQRELAVTPGAALAIVSNSNAESADLFDELAEAIATQLSADGYRIVPRAEASFLVFFDFGTDPVFPGSRHAASGYTADELGIEWSTARVHRLDAPVNVRGSKARGLSSDKERWLHWFLVSMVDAEELRRTGETRVAWRGMARLVDTFHKDPPASETLLDRLMEAALEFVGRSEDWTLSGGDRGP